MLGPDREARMGRMWQMDESDVWELSGGVRAKWANVWRGNVLKDDAGMEANSGRRVVVYSGWVQGEDDAEAARLSWSPATWARCLERLAALRARCVATAGAELLIRPNARHVVSDVPTCQKLLGEEALEGVGIVLDVAGMLTPTMMRDAADHLGRLALLVEHLPRVRGVIAANEAGLISRVAMEALVAACRARIEQDAGFAWIEAAGDETPSDFQIGAGGGPIG